MKKRTKAFLCLLLAAVMLLGSTGVTMQAEAADSVSIDETHFPDDVFRDYVSEKFDTDGDGTLSADEISRINYVNLVKWKVVDGTDVSESLPITDLSGIEYFTDLVSLEFWNSNLEKLDVSNNTKLEGLYIYNTQLTELDLSANTELKSLACQGTKISKLDLSGNTKLEWLACGNYEGLTDLDVSNCDNLTYFSATGARIMFVEIGETVDIFERLKDSTGYINSANVEFSDKDVGYATITDNQITGVSEGEFDLYGSTDDHNAHVSITVYVVDDLSNVNKKPESISMSQWCWRAIGEHPDALNVTYSPYGTYEPIVKWESSDSKVVSFNDDGSFVVKTVPKGDPSSDEPGEVTITATSESGLVATTSLSTNFTDVDDYTAYYYNPVYWAFNNGITTGKRGGDRFAPSDTCTRGQIVTFLWRLAGEPEPSGDNPFSDIKSSAYYYKAVLWAYENGITTGRRGGKTFDPNGTCTRREIVTFLWRYAGKPEPTTATSKFSDVQDSSAYYYKAVLWAVDNGITTGKRGGKTFDPMGLCTRAMAVTFIYRYAK